MKYKIKMLTDKMGCDDGVIYPVEYVTGHEYEIGKSLMDAFIAAGACEHIVVEEKKVEAPKETKAPKPTTKKKKA